MPYLNMNGLFAGMESMLEGDVEINNNVSAPDADSPAAINDALEDENTAAEGAEIEKDTEQEATETEMIATGLNQACNMYDHVKQFGIDRTFLSLYNRDGGLTKMIGVQFPACESMDAVGDPYSSYSSAFIEAMESGDGLWAKIVNFFRKIADAIKNFFTKIWDWLASSFGSITRKIGALRKAANNAVPKNATDLKDSKLSLYTASSKFSTVSKKVASDAGAMIGAVADTVNTKTKGVKNAIERMMQKMNNGKAPTRAFVDSVTTAGNTYDANRSNFQFNEKEDKFDKYDDKLQEKVDAITKSVKELEPKEVKYSSSNFKTSKDIDEALSFAQFLAEVNYKAKEHLEVFNNSAKMFKDEQQRLAQYSTGSSLTSEDVRKITKESSQISKQTSKMSKICALCPKLAAMVCKDVSAVLSTWFNANSVDSAAGSRKAAYSIKK